MQSNSVKIPQFASDRKFSSVGFCKPSLAEEFDRRKGGHQQIAKFSDGVFSNMKRICRLVLHGVAWTQEFTVRGRTQEGTIRFQDAFCLFDESSGSINMLNSFEARIQVVRPFYKRQCCDVSSCRAKNRSFLNPLCSIECFGRQINGSDVFRTMIAQNERTISCATSSIEYTATFRKTSRPAVAFDMLVSEPRG